MACILDKNISQTCDDLKSAIGGFVPILRLVPISLLTGDWEAVRDATTREVDELPLIDPAATEVIIKVATVKEGLEPVFTPNLIDGSNVITYTHRLTAKILAENARTLEKIEVLNRGTYVAILEGINKKFYVIGQNNGLSAISSDGMNRGFKGNAQDVSYTGVLTSDTENSLQYIFNVGTYATTKAYLEERSIGYVAPTP